MLRCVNKNLFCMVVIASLHCQQSSVFAGAFMQSEGSGQVIAGFNILQSSRAFDNNGVPIQAAKTHKTEPSIYIEYGVKDWLTLFAQPSYVHNKITAPITADYNGLGYTEMGGRVRIFNTGSFVLSAQGSVRVPGPSDGHNLAQAGNTGPETDIRMQAGKSFDLWGASSFVDGNIGYRTRSGHFFNEWRSDLTLGIRPNFAPKFLIMLQSFNVVSNGKSALNTPSSSHSKLQLNAVYGLTKQWSIQLGVYKTVAGRNYTCEQGVVAAVWRTF